MIEEEDAVTVAIRRFTSTYEQVRDEIESLDPRESFHAATRLRDALGMMESLVGGLRATALARIQEVEGLSLAALARSLEHMSKQRVDQLIRRARGRPVRKYRRRLTVVPLPNTTDGDAAS